jgi:hypothetical protein
MGNLFCKCKHKKISVPTINIVPCTPVAPSELKLEDISPGTSSDESDPIGVPQGVIPFLGEIHTSNFRAYYRCMTIPFLKEIATALGTIKIGKKEEIFLGIVKVQNEPVKTMLEHLSENSLRVLRAKLHAGDNILEHLKLPNSCVSRKSGRVPIDKNLRKIVWDTWCGDVRKATCYCCNNTVMDCMGSEWHCGHVISVKDGGTTTAGNLRPICATCNLSMSSMNMIDYIKSRGLNSKILHEVH